MFYIEYINGYTVQVEKGRRARGVEYSVSLLCQRETGDNKPAHQNQMSPTEMRIFEHFGSRSVSATDLAGAHSQVPWVRALARRGRYKLLAFDQKLNGKCM